jgi:ppGpp synthetase/RelA/SpoT-type nucleotidyltranferase
MNTQNKNLYQDLYTQVAEEFNVERAFVKVVAMEIMYTPNPTGIPLIERVRSRVKHALELIDKAED